MLSLAIKTQHMLVPYTITSTDTRRAYTGRRMTALQRDI